MDWDSPLTQPPRRSDTELMLVHSFSYSSIKTECVLNLDPAFQLLDSIKVWQRDGKQGFETRWQKPVHFSSKLLWNLFLHYTKVCRQQRRKAVMIVQNNCPSGAACLLNVVSLWEALFGYFIAVQFKWWMSGSVLTWTNKPHWSLWHHLELRLT